MTFQKAITSYASIAILARGIMEVSVPTPRNDDGTANFSRIGRGNKNRGRKFEREVADILKWTRVPYSGAMSEWGGGDVVDGFYSRNGLWSAECKTQQPGPVNSISIKDKWIRQAGKVTDRKSIIITKNVGSKINDAFVFMPEHVYEWFCGRLDHKYEHKSYVTNARGKGRGFVVQRRILDKCQDGTPISIVVLIDKNLGYGSFDTWVVFRLLDFMNTIHSAELMVTDAELANEAT